jgi:hypothetical protein
MDKHKPLSSYPVIIKSLEINTTLNQLGIDIAIHQGIREQFIQSLPRMTGLRDLQVNSQFFDLDDQRTLAAFVKM